jgi:hypothetical protein
MRWIYTETHVNTTCFIEANKNNVVRLLFVLKRVYRFPFTHFKAVKLETTFTLLLFLSQMWEWLVNWTAKSHGIYREKVKRYFANQAVCIGCYLKLF